jgi:hypothetical protein
MSFVASCKLDLNRSITLLYRKILRWETDIDPELIATLKFKFRMPTLAHLKTSNDKLTNLQAVMDLAVSIMLTEKEQKGPEGNAENPDIVREFKKQLVTEYCPDLDVERWEELVQIARDKVNEMRLKETSPTENLVDDAQEEM